VMDYPHPSIKAGKNGKVVLDQAYATGIGAWDKEAIRFGYSEADKAERTAALNAAFERGLKFITDQDARPTGSAHPYAHLWDNGNSASEELENLLKIRKQVLADFGPNHIADGMPFSSIEEVLVPMYFLHRYQLEAAAKVIGGLDYSYAIKGNNDLVTAWVDPKAQKKALNAMLKAIAVENLRIPESVLQTIPPRAFGYSRTRETFKSKTGVTFDALSPAQTLTDMTLSLLLHPQRMNRLLEFNSRNSRQPSPNDIFTSIIEETIYKEAKTGYDGEIQRIVAKSVLEQMMALAAGEEVHDQVAAIAMYQIGQIADYMRAESKNTSAVGQKAHIETMLRLIAKFNDEPEKFKRSMKLSPPDGSPIGSTNTIYCGH
ncbi:MAG: zinc-dependent metalloprotease, partial [Cyclobacteriaceae bacterium]